MKLSEVILRGTRAAQPAATAVPIGTIYYVTDESKTERSSGSAWQDISDAGSGGITQLTGDVTAGPGAGSQAATIANNAVTTAKIIDDAVTYAKIQDVSATARALGRKTAGAGVVEELTLSEILDFIGSAAQGDILYRGSTSWERLAAGTSGHFLKTNGAGANPAWAAGGGGSGDVFRVNRHLTAVEIRGLNTTPITLVAAPGADKIIEPVRALFWATRTTTAYSADMTFRIRYNSIATELFSIGGFSLNIGIAGETFKDLPRQDFNFGYGGSDPRNKALEISASADTTTGTGTVRVSITYWVGEW